MNAHVSNVTVIYDRTVFICRAFWQHSIKICPQVSNEYKESDGRADKKHKHRVEKGTWHCARILYVHTTICCLLDMLLNTSKAQTCPSRGAKSLTFQVLLTRFVYFDPYNGRCAHKPLCYWCLRDCVELGEVSQQPKVERDVPHFANSTTDDMKVMILGSEEWKTFSAAYFLSYPCLLAVYISTIHLEAHSIYSDAE